MNTIRKIVVIGPESTGKSTISEALAKELNTLWVPEYARAYIDELNRPYEEADLKKIAEGQLALEDKLAATADKWLVCDTDLHVIRVWSEHRFGNCDSWILQQIATRPYDLYLLTNIDIPWQDDPQREHPQEHMRQYFYNIYKSLVIESGIPYAILSGNEQQRLQTALEAIKNIQ